MASSTRSDSSPSAALISIFVACVAEGLRTAMRAGHVARGLQRLALRRNRVDEPEAQGLRGREDFAQHGHAAHELRSEPAHRTLRAGPARDDAEAGFGRSQLHVILGDTKVGRRRKFETPTQGMPVERSDQGLAQPGEGVEGTMAMANPGHAEILRRMRRPGLDVATGTEAPVALARDDGNPDLRTSVDRMRSAFQRQDHLVVERVELVGPGQRDDGNRPVVRERNAAIACLKHRASSP